MPGKNPLGALFDIIESFPPVDLQTAANAGDWVSLKNAYGALLVFASGLGTAGDDPVITIEQATDNAGAGNKALSPSQATPKNVWKKQAATDLSAVTAWTDGNPDITTNVYDENGTSAEQDLLVAIWIDAADLDVAGGFDHVQASVADVGGNAQVGACFWIVMLNYPNDPANVLSSL